MISTFEVFNIKPLNAIVTPYESISIHMLHMQFNLLAWFVSMAATIAVAIVIAETFNCTKKLDSNHKEDGDQL